MVIDLQENPSHTRTQPKYPCFVLEHEFILGTHSLPVQRPSKIAYALISIWTFIEFSLALV